MLYAAGIPTDMLAWPYGQGNDPAAYAAGMNAERALVELGNELNPYACLYSE